MDIELISFLIGFVLGELLISVKISWLLYGKLNIFGVKGKLIKKEHMMLTNIKLKEKIK